jgi:putative hydrolase of the HAD superfamily
VYFDRTQRRFLEILGPYLGSDVDALAALQETEHRNLPIFGYGIKGFTLSMVEVAIELSGGRVSAAEIGELLQAGREMLSHPVDLLDGVAEGIDELVDAGYRLVLITKGDLHHQEVKIAGSGLEDRFERIDIVAEKDPLTYRKVIERMDVQPTEFCMVGNSVRSDVLPVLSLGGRAVHIPYHLTWAHERAEHDGTVPTLTSFAELPAWLAEHGGRPN